MYSYITKEIPRLITENFPQCDKNKWGIFGHSMGGHGAIVIGLRNPDIFKSISAFAPICNPTKSQWGQKVLYFAVTSKTFLIVLPAKSAC